MRLLIVNTLYAPLRVGGAEESVRELAVGMAARGHDVAVATLVPSVGPPLPPVEDIDGVRVYRHATSAINAMVDSSIARSKLQKAAVHLRHWHDPAALRFLRNVRLAHQPDLVHTNNIAGFGTSAWLAAEGLPLVHTLRDYFLLCISSTMYRNDANCERVCAECRILKAPFAIARDSPDHVVGVSKSIIDLHTSLGAISPQVPFSVVNNDPTLRESTASSGDRSGVTFGFIGKLANHKGTWLALDAFGMIEDQNARLVIAGNSDRESDAELGRRLAADERITYIGHVPAEDFYRLIDIVVVPSQWREPFGRVAVEALDAGCEVIVSNLGGLPEAIGEHERGAVVESWDSVHAWKIAMQDAAARPANQRLDNSISASVPSNDVCQQYEAVYVAAAASRLSSSP